MVSILLLQDILAILVLLGIGSATDGRLDYAKLFLITVSLPSVLLFVYLVEKFVLKKIFAEFSEVREYMFLVAVAWCLGIAQLAETVGLSYEIGAFIAGLAIAASPMVYYISSQMQPIRDFFLVLFFFLIGASFNLQHFGVIIMPVLVLTIIFLVLKPLVFRFLLRQVNEIKNISWEIGLRLGQLSEFSLLVIFLASRSQLVGTSVVYLVQAVTMIMFIASSCLVVMRYPEKRMPEGVMIENNDIDAERE
jgi:Kef-type K+ transport system membrane component KefB